MTVDIVQKGRLILSVEFGQGQQLTMFNVTGWRVTKVKECKRQSLGSHFVRPSSFRVIRTCKYVYLSGENSWGFYFQCKHIHIYTDTWTRKGKGNCRVEWSEEKMRIWRMKQIQLEETLELFSSRGLQREELLATTNDSWVAAVWCTERDGGESVQFISEWRGRGRDITL